MFNYTFNFDRFLDKHNAIEYVRKEIEPDDEDEALTELRYVFFSGVELTKHQKSTLLKAIPCRNYSEHEL